jgi:hypothetical protein
LIVSFCLEKEGEGASTGNFYPHPLSEKKEEIYNQSELP